MASSLQIDGTVDYTRQLLSMVHPARELKQKGFALKYLEEEDFKLKQRCQNCNKRVSSRPPRTAFSGKGGEARGKTRGSGSGSQATGQKDYVLDPSSLEQPLHAADAATTVTESATSSKQPGAEGINNVSQRVWKELKPKCRYHPGTQERRQRWTCCNAAISSPGCKSALQHDPPPNLTMEFVARYQVHRTPRRQPKISKATAVAIDCEMGTAFDAETALIRVTMVDYFTSVVYVDTLVMPDVPLQNYNTRYSGVTKADMDSARRNGTCLYGEAAARAAIWQWVDDQTVVVGHDVNNDLVALKWLHTVVLDSLMLESETRKKAEAIRKAEEEAAEDAAAGDDEESAQAQQGDGAGGANDGGAAEELKKLEIKSEEQKRKERAARKAEGLGLKAVTKLLLGRDIQRGKGHDSLEDAVASRDIVHHHVCRRLEEAKSRPAASVPKW